MGQRLHHFSLGHVLIKGQAVVAIETLSLLSFVRYHLAKKVHQTANFCLILALTLLIYAGYYGIELLFFMRNNLAVTIIDCANLESKDINFPSMITTFKEGPILFIGMIYVVLFMLFMRPNPEGGRIKCNTWFFRSDFEIYCFI